MKILYLAPITDGTGYAHAANQTILGLDAAGVDVVVREVKLAGQVIDPHPRIKELIKKSTEGVTHTIQHLLPPAFAYRTGTKNIGYFHIETSKFDPSGWQYYLNLMDEVLVCSPQNVEACKDSGVTKPVHNIPIPHDLEWYKNYAPETEPRIPYKDAFVFYNIANYGERKNIRNLIRTYLSTFVRHDNVVLVLKTYDETGTKEAILKDMDWIKDNLRMHASKQNYPPIVILHNYMSDESIYKIHHIGDCFVTTERAAAWNIPAFDAMAFGKPVITTDWGGQTQFVQGPGTELLETRTEKVFGMGTCAYRGIYTGYETWQDPDLMQLSDAMLRAYNRDQSMVVDMEERNSILEPFSLVNAGNTIKKVLENV